MNKCRSVAIPAISTGVNRIPSNMCALIFFDSLNKYSIENVKASYLNEVRLILYDGEVYR